MERRIEEREKSKRRRENGKKKEQKMQIRIEDEERPKIKIKIDRRSTRGKIDREKRDEKFESKAQGGKIRIG